MGTEIEEIKNISTFSELQVKFEEWVSKETVIDKEALFLLGYNSIISYPALVLTTGSTVTEIVAAKKCYELMIRYAKSRIQSMINSEDERTRLAGKLYLIPPSKRLLAGCDEFYLLNFLVKAETESLSEDEIKNIDGNDYAKQWLYIFNKGYKGEPVEKALDFNSTHLIDSSTIIRKMNLNEESKRLMDVNRIAQLIDKYYRIDSSETSGYGCSVLILITGTLGLLLSCM